MSLKFENWTKNWQSMDAFFNSDEIAAITNKLKKIAVRHIVYCSFESRFAKSGGLAAVTTRILPYLNKLKGVRQTILLTPFYPHIINEAKLEKTGKTFDVHFNGKNITAELLKYTQKVPDGANDGVINEFFIKAPGFFESKNHLDDPYIYVEDDPAQNEAALRENALFFCKAAPYAAKAAGLEKDIVFHLQEWQTTLIALTSKIAMLKGDLTSCGSIQTMHNTFDSYIPPAELGKIIDETYLQRYKQHSQEKGHTAYQLGLRAMDGPITAVSDHYAAEFTTDVLQTEYFANHLQEIFHENSAYGVNNGMFIDFPPEFSPTKPITLAKIKKTKKQKRKDLLAILEKYKPAGRFGELTYKGGPITKLPGDIPIFIMSGRLDTIQKGFDILLQAIERFEEDEIKVILTPMPVNDSDLDYFRDVAEKSKGNLTVFPIRMTEGYKELQIGSAFGVMPSIYEPFGAAVEYMVNGTLTIARETGGLKDQVEHKKCGLLYKEDTKFYTRDNIKAFIDAASHVRDRKNNPWAVDMADSLYNTMKDAANLFKNHPDSYYKLILNGFKKALKFNWESSAKKYAAAFDKIKRF